MLNKLTENKPSAGCLTVCYDNLQRCVATNVQITDIYTGNKATTLGIWDTGATSCVITKDLVTELQLTPIGQIVVHGVHGNKRVNSYIIKMNLVGKSDIQIATIATECDTLSEDGSVGMLIGMDVISNGDFAITNFQNKTTMSFRTPSSHKIDYETVN